jgi:hypothetical protein
MTAKTIYIKRGQRQYRIKQHPRALAIQREETQAAAAAQVQMFAVTAYDGTAWNWPVINTLIDQYERIVDVSVKNAAERV